MTTDYPASVLIGDLFFQLIPLSGVCFHESLHEKTHSAMHMHTHTHTHAWLQEHLQCSCQHCHTSTISRSRTLDLQFLLCVTLTLVSQGYQLRGVSAYSYCLRSPTAVVPFLGPLSSCPDEYHLVEGAPLYLALKTLARCEPLSYLPSKLLGYGSAPKCYVSCDHETFFHLSILRRHVDPCVEGSRLSWLLVRLSSDLCSLVLYSLAYAQCRGRTHSSLRL